MKNKTLINSKTIFLISVLVIILTILGVWLFGIGENNTVFKNSILSTTILSVAFFLFISVGLYKGLKMKENLGKITDSFDKKKIEHLKQFDLSGGSFEVFEVGEGIIVGVIINVLLWILVTIFLTYFIWAFSAVFWMLILIFMAMLYWIFFRALRLVFKNSADCKGKIGISMLYAFCYTILYNFWIFGLIFLTK